MSVIRERFWYPVSRAPRTKIGEPIKCVLWFEGGFFRDAVLHNLDGTPVASAGALHGDAIKDWGATHFMLLDGPRS